MQFRLVVILETEKNETALRVISNLNKIILSELESLEPYHKGGMNCVLRKDVEALNWETAVFSCLELAQSFGRSWELTGQIDEQVDLVSSEISVSGVNWAHLQLVRNQGR